REIEEDPRGPDGQRVRSLEAQKPHARLALARDVRAQVYLRKVAEERRRREAAERRALDLERHDAEPRLALEQVELEPLRDPRAEERRIDLPMEERQVAPGLPRDPRLVRHRPRPA